jgi:hypothetical protein
MENLDHLILLDLALIILLWVLSFLSQKLGAALKIRPYYKIFHVSIILVLCAAFINIIDTDNRLNSFAIISLSLRIIAGCTALFPCLRYWNWLFSEFLKLRGTAQ